MIAGLARPIPPLSLRGSAVLLVNAVSAARSMQ